MTLPVTEMMATMELQTRAIFRHPASVCLYFLVDLISVHLVPLYLVADVFLSVLDRCIWFVVLDTVCLFFF